MARSAPVQTVQQIALAQLRPHPRNYQAHPAAQITKLAASLKRFGQRKNIVVWQQDGFFYVVAGHGLVEAAQQINYPALLANVFPPETPEDEIIGYMVADNETARWAEPDLAQLEALLQSQLDAGYPLESVGYTLDELEALQQQLEAEAHGQRRAIDDPGGGGDAFDTSQAETRCQPGDLWQLGKHRLLCGDSTKQEDVARLMDGEKAAIIVTSAPYNQGLDKFKPSGMHTETRWVANVQSGSYADSKPEEEYQHEQVSALCLWSGVLTVDASVFYNHKNRYRDKQVVSPWRWLEQTGAKVRQEIIWKREGSVTQNARMFMPCDERIFWLYFGDDFYFDDTTEHKTFSSVWEMNSHKDYGKSEHGCAFPLELPWRCIVACSHPGDIVLEPYCGSGTTMIATERAERRCYGLEIEPRYCDVILARWEAETGGTAVRL